MKEEPADAGIIAEYAMRNYDQMRLYKPLDKNLERKGEKKQKNIRNLT